MINTRQSTTPAFRFTDEEMEIAKGTDLPDLLEHLGYQVRRVGRRYHTTKEMDSIRIKERRTWRRYSSGQGGDAITFLQEFCGMRFREAVNYLLEFNGSRARDPPDPHPKPAQPEEKPAFALPIPCPDQRRVFAYLQKRGIAPQVIQGFIESGLLYEDALHHNCVFVGRDSSGKAVFASKRGTYDLDGSGFKGDVPGSNKDVSFRLPCDPALGWVAVFEAPIDLMSFCTLHRQVRSNAVALCSLYQGPLDTYLRENLHLKQIILCLDADRWGREAAEKFQAEYTQRGYAVSTHTPVLGKDWNELLQHQVFGKEIPARTPKQSQSKKEEIGPVADLGKLISDKTAADTQWREQRQAEREAAASLRDTSVAEIAASPDAFTNYLNMQGDNPTYSAGNIAMVMEQNPEATVVFTRDRWKAKGRSVLETEQDKGSKIFVRTSTGRGYTLADAFDVSQTQGRDIRTPHLEDNTQEMETALTALLNYSPVPVTVQEGLETKAYYNPWNMTLSINPNLSDSEAFGAIAAEIAHARFHDHGFNWAYSREDCELSAQSVSYILCRRFGISRETPDLSKLPELFRDRQVSGQLGVLNAIRDMSKQIGGGIEKSIAPPQRTAPAVHRDAR